VVYLEIGAHFRRNTCGAQVDYPDEDLCAISNADGSWVFLYKGGTLY